jgi:tRNA(Arg) A34 adenosine deaminase TadA
MTPINWLLNAAMKATEARSNYFLVVRGDKVLAEARNLQDALNIDAKGCTLYVFCEPSPLELGAAEAAGIEKIFYGVSKHRGKQLGIYREGLRPQRLQRARVKINKEWLPKW